MLGTGSYLRMSKATTTDKLFCNYLAIGELVGPQTATPGKDPRHENW